MKVLFINSVCGFGSTGKITVDLASIEGVESLICYGRKNNYSNLENVYKTTNFLGNSIAAIDTILFDKHGLSNRKETYKLVNKITTFNPDIIHLHNLHGYYINIEVLLTFLQEYNKPVVWTLHDCWPLTGYCPHFDAINCDKYKTECNHCPKKFSYPFSLFKQNTTNNFYLKKNLINKINNLTFITPSKWLESIVKNSFIKNPNVITINNGINLDCFKPTLNKNSDFTILFVSSIWTKLKGLEEIEKTLPLLNKDITVKIIGSINKPSSALKERCTLIERTDNIQELVNLYSSSHLLVNPTLEETLGLVNIESLACGTPVITYNTGGSPETIDEKTGIVIEKYNYKSLASCINELKSNYNFKIDDCVNRSKLFSKEIMRNKYYDLYKELVR